MAGQMRHSDHWRHQTGLLLVLAAVLINLPTCQRAVAQNSAPAFTPLPPIRPADVAKPPPPENRATHPAPAAGPKKAKAPASNGALHPLEVPGTLAQRRAAIHLCVLQWRQMQRDRTGGDQIWRDFSQTCIDGQIRNSDNTSQGQKNPAMYQKPQ
jgi:hypothetical protein